MSFKQGLGFSSIDPTDSDEDEFSYVGDNRPRSGRSDSIFSDYESSSNLSLASSFSEKMKAQRAAEKFEEERPEKKVASYYLELETISRLKKWADTANASYSSVVEQAIQAHLVNMDG